MTRSKQRWRTPQLKILARPSSERVIHCYGFEGKAYHHWPCPGEIVELVLVDAARRVMVACRSGSYDSLPTTAVQRGDGWRVLGWRVMDGTLRHGDYDAVDPCIAT